MSEGSGFRCKATNIYIYILVVFLLILLLTALTPMLADDYSYSFSFHDRSRIECLGDILTSLEAHRYSMNGRAIAHFFAHLFLLLPKPVFVVLNALVFTLLIYFISDISSGTDPKSILLLFTITALIWLFTPVFGQVFLWLDGACNYSWALLFIFAFLYPYIYLFLWGKDLLFSGLTKRILFLIVAFLAGSYSEGASFAGLCIAFAFITCIWKKFDRAPRWLIWGLAVACLGYLYLMTAPSEWSGRTSAFSMLLVAKNIKRIFSAPMESMLPLFLIYAALLSACISFKSQKSVIVCAVILMLGAWASILPFALALYLPWRSLLAMCLFLVLACSIMLEELLRLGHDKVIKIGVSVLGTLFAFQLILGIGDIANVYIQFCQRESTITEAVANGETEVEVPIYVADTKYSGAYLLADIYTQSDLWPNYDLAAYYGIDQIVGIEPVLDINS